MAGWSNPIPLLNILKAYEEIGGDKVDVVHTLEEAQAWFLEHSEGSVLCMRGDKQLEAETYREAVAFYD